MGGRNIGVARGLRWAWVAWLLGCTAIVDPQQDAVKCEVLRGSVDPCLEIGLRCSVDGDGSRGFCQECLPEVERCNGLDDDCDGMADEAPDQGWAPEDCNGLDDDCDSVIDEGHDEDGDGYTWCGGGKTELIDCVPTDATIHPSVSSDLDGMVTQVVELCDGRDNDCDTRIDEAANCAQDCATTGCTGSLICDSNINRCVAPQSVGSACGSDTQCETGFCAPAAALDLDSDVIQAGVCATACCSTTDCASGSVCFAPGTGARVCVRPEIAGRGTGVAGAECRSDANCASGVCASEQCRPLCRSDSACDGESCMLDQSLLRAGSGWFCNAGIGRGDGGDLCTVFDPTGCKSGLCVESRCISACGSALDCPSGTNCGYHMVSSLAGDASWITGCAAKAASGSVCCTDADCGVGSSCGLHEAGDHWEMRCK